jgi:dihydrofolate synthase/folylpolyglutamate synthase
VPKGHSNGIGRSSIGVSVVNLEYSDALRYLYSYHTLNRDLADRSVVLRHLLKAAGCSTVRDFPQIIQVTGTNGKGSTVLFAEAMLRAAGRRTLCLTSPHISSVRERIRIDGVAVSRQYFSDLLAAVSPFLEATKRTPYQPTPMEVISLLAMQVHHILGPNWVGIYEVGVGGLRDSTNVFNGSIVGITSIGEDHVTELGGSLSAVVEEKLQLCPTRRRLRLQRQRPDVQRLIDSALVRLQAFGDPLDSLETSVGRLFVQRLGIEGSWQEDNAGLAAALASEVLGRSVIRSCASRVSQVSIPRRLERRIFGDTHLILDGAHNVPAVERLLQYVRVLAAGAPAGVILGFSKSKDWQSMLKLILKSGLFSWKCASTASRPRGVSPTDIAVCAMDEGHPMEASASLSDALTRFMGTGLRHCWIFGSLLLAADLDRALGELGRTDLVQGEEPDPRQRWMVA